MKSEGAAAVSLDGKIYLTGGASADPMSYPGAVYYRDLWVFILTVAWRRNFWV